MDMQIDILTLFPESVDAMLNVSILGRAQERGYIAIRTHQIRAYTTNKQMQVDDYPYGGGRGAVMQADPLFRCWEHVVNTYGPGRTIFMSPCGRTFTQSVARELKAQYDHLILVCGHYEGIDQRVIDAFGDEEISIGDYVLTGGELASLVVADSVLRLQPGVLAEEKGYQDESYWDGLLEYPQFTRPEVWEGRAVPPVLLTGDHKKIDEWRGAQSRERTRERRPDLYDAWCESHPLTELPKWKRGENMRLVKNDEQLKLCAALMAEGRRTVCAPVCDEEYLEKMTPDFWLPDLTDEKKNGWAFYLHYTKDAADGMVGVCHKTGEIGHLFVTEAARGRGYGAKMLDFARKKLPEHDHPTMGVLNTNTRAIALYKRMGWRLTGTVLHRCDPAEEGTFAAVYCEELEMQYRG